MLLNGANTFMKSQLNSHATTIYQDVCQDFQSFKYLTSKKEIKRSLKFVMRIRINFDPVLIENNLIFPCKNEIDIYIVHSRYSGLTNSANISILPSRPFLQKYNLGNSEF